MPADTRKGPSAPSEHVPATEGRAILPGSAMGLPAAFKAALGARPTEPHPKLPRMPGHDAARPGKADRLGQAPKPAPVRTSGPRTGHK